jgi:hypothetical protein
VAAARLRIVGAAQLDDLAAGLFLLVSTFEVELVDQFLYAV